MGLFVLGYQWFSANGSASDRRMGHSKTKGPQIFAALGLLLSL
jgi:hypothetical protein